MPRLTDAYPKYRKHRASGQAVVTLNGRDFYLGPHGSATSKLGYDRLIAEWLASGRSSAFGTPADELSVSEMLVAFLRHAKTYYVGKGQGTFERFKVVLRPLRQLYGKTNAADFGPEHFKAVRQQFIDKGNARPYVNDQMRRVVQVFRWAAAEGLIPASVPQTLGIIPGLRKGRCKSPEPAPVLPVDDAIVDATLPHLPEVVADMVRFQRFTGCRPAEVCLLRPCDVDRSNDDVWVYVPESHKTEHHGRARAIFIGPKAQEVLLRYLARDSQAYCFRPCDSEEKRRAELHANRVTPLSCGNRPGTNRKRRRSLKKTPGDRYTTDSYRRAITRACEKHDIEKWSPNRLRHTAATEIRREFGLEAAQVVLGHAQANVTEVYAERDVSKGIEVARRIG